MAQITMMPGIQNALPPDSDPAVHVQRLVRPTFKSNKCFRWMAWEEETNRLELDGVFTASDLRNLAAWLEDPIHPCLSQELPVMKVELSKLA